MRGFARGVVCALLVLVVACVGALAGPSITVVDAPEVTVANPSGNMTQENFNPEYVFSSEVRVVNDWEESQVHLEAWVYADPSVRECPEDEDSFPVSFVRKTRTLDPGQEARFGGSTASGDGGDAYWPFAVSERYQNAETGEVVEIGDDTYTFCVLVRVTGSDAACDKPDNEACVVARAPFQTYVRGENQPPEITQFSISDENPEPGQEVLLQGDAVDEDTEPRPDDLFFTWRVNGAEHSGQTARHTFGQAGTYTVTLEVTDGFDTVTQSREVVVEGDGDGVMPDEAPLPVFLVVLAALGAGWVSSARRGPR